MSGGGHVRRGPCQERAMSGEGHVRRGQHWEGEKMLASSTSMSWPNISVANISDSKALGVRVECYKGATPEEGDNVDNFYINAMAKHICCKHK